MTAQEITVVFDGLTSQLRPKITDGELFGPPLMEAADPSPLHLGATPASPAPTFSKVGNIQKSDDGGTGPGDESNASLLA